MTTPMPEKLRQTMLEKSLVFTITSNEEAYKLGFKHCWEQMQPILEALEQAAQDLEHFNYVAPIEITKDWMPYTKVRLALSQLKGEKYELHNNTRT